LDWCFGNIFFFPLIPFPTTILARTIKQTVWLFMQNSIRKFIGLFIFLSGLLNIFSALFAISSTRLQILESVLPIQVPDTSRTLVLIAGIFLLFLAKGIWESRFRAWWLSVLTLSISLFLHLFKGLDFEESFILMIPLSLLIFKRQLFYVSSGRLEFLTAVKASLIGLAVLFLYTAIGFLFFANQFNRPLSLQNISEDYINAVWGVGDDLLIPKTPTAIWFQNSVSIFGFFTTIFVVAALFNPVLSRNTPTRAGKEIVRDLVLHSAIHSVSYFNLMNDKTYYITQAKDGVVSYKIKNSIAVVLGDPITKYLHDTPVLMKEFAFFTHTKGLRTAFYQIDQQSIYHYKKLGFKTLKIGEEAILKLADFNLEGSARAEIRHCVNRMKKLGVEYKWMTMDSVPYYLFENIYHLHQNWSREKGNLSLTYSMNFFPFPLDKEAWVLAVLSADQKLIACLSFFPYQNHQGMVLDLMLRDPQASNGTMEAAIAESARFFQEHDVQELSLGMAPLSDVELSKQQNIMEKGIRLIYEKFNYFYGYRSLFKFKDKFIPEWRHKYVAYQQLQDLPTVVLAIIAVHVHNKRLWQSQ
jgi:phosphatidylglycerol lysyltransferase